MTNLDCTVVTCVYNKDRCCCKENIKVEGSDARHNRDTFCTSFRERGDAATNAADCGCPDYLYVQRSLQVQRQPHQRGGQQCLRLPADRMRVLPLQV